MKISKSKKELAKIIHENGGWRDGAEWAAQDRIVAFFSGGKPAYDKVDRIWCSNGDNGNYISSIESANRVANWHQTILSRDEYFHLYPAQDEDGWIEWKGGDCPVDGDLDVSVKCCGEDSIGTGKAKSWSWGHCGDGADIIAYRLHKPEQVEPQYCESVTRSIPEPVTAPTLDQLLQDYRNASDFAATKQAEADEAAKMRDERWRAAQARACELGVHISVELVVDAEMRESEPVITDWRDLRVGDVIAFTGSDVELEPGEYEVCGTEGAHYPGKYSIQVSVKGLRGRWISNDKWRFIRRQ